MNLVERLLKRLEESANLSLLPVQKIQKERAPEILAALSEIPEIKISESDEWIEGIRYDDRDQFQRVLFYKY